MSLKEKGCIQVYTGNGKGKTTAALGLGLRATGHGYRVLMIQFMKGWKTYGELNAVKNLPGFEIIQAGLPNFVCKDGPKPEDKAQALIGLEKARQAIMQNQYDLIILDEINVALDYGLVPLDAVLELIQNKPEHMELVLTGRYAPPEIIAAADLVTEMTLHKHPYYQGVPAREGIEY
ncbi:MAG: cob(I)yrinic acid a,c-diamide adenosyltransferase [Bacillota bacterium]